MDRLALIDLQTLPEHQARAVVNSVLSAPSVAARLRVDDGPACYVASPAVQYQAAMVNGGLAGIFPLVAQSAAETHIHVALLPWAIQYSRALSKMAVAAAFARETVCEVVALILRGLESVVNLARKVGFQLAGIVQNAAKRGGEEIAAYRLVMTRERWESMK